MITLEWESPLNASEMGETPVSYTHLFVSPPFGLNLFVASPLANVPVGALGKKCIPFTLCFIAALLLITFIPAISLAL